MLPRDIATWTDPAVFFKITDFAAEDEKKKKKAVCEEDRIKFLELSDDQTFFP